MLSNRDDIIALSNLLKPNSSSNTQRESEKNSSSSDVGLVQSTTKRQIKSGQKECAFTIVKDDRPPPRYEMYYKQIIGTKDVFHGALCDKSGSCSEDSTHIVVKVHFPDVLGAKELDLNVSKNHFTASSKDK
mmetsp:Transcript_23174/g.34793  ORF Transcript_23174/g.34793 Transcript_23174/m.34793 type:complete len:132 (-) Transcript_23174:909-1304(-)|eukprot:CAMPEP_0116019858 /NCGR_PEP_ID=MMETSP0321-20121206/9475_1 /TAXON_ID=163516 /ORGANISM="Leptocylindrus danicus var. danicus, Strain B650" /LENGTH=131 /DNA_ID=CAMNT_0003490485 /DNA_START=810 /DNA_END=1205 /DNA_ORIENTATION=-